MRLFCLSVAGSDFDSVVAATLMLQLMMPSNTRSFSAGDMSATLSLQADVSSMRTMCNAGQYHLVFILL